MDQANQSKDTKVVLIWVGIGVAAFLIILVIIALILLFVRARKRFKELDDEIRMNSLRRSIKQYEGNVNERSKDQGFEVATTEEFSKHSAGPAGEPDPGSNAESRDSQSKHPNDQSGMVPRFCDIQNGLSSNIKANQPHTHDTNRKVTTENAKSKNGRKAERQRARPSTSSDTDSDTKVNLIKRGRKKKSRMRKEVTSAQYSHEIDTKSEVASGISNHLSNSRDGVNDEAKMEPGRKPGPSNGRTRNASVC